MDTHEHVDAVVVGSGFGGSVSAYRLAEAGRSVVVLERGRSFPPGSFPRDPAGIGRNMWDPAEGLYGMFDIRSFEGLDAVVASGLGGGSLIYANVLIRKDEDWFVDEEALPGGGYEDWPVTRADLDPHYDRVERMLGGREYPYADSTPKTMAYREAADRAGYQWRLPLLAVSFGSTPEGEPARGVPLEPAVHGNIHGVTRRSCTLCGECDLGCNEGAKNTLDHTYLSAAAHHGADLRTGHEVVGISPRPGGGYEVRFIVHDEGGVPADANRRTIRTLTCDRLVLAAGTLGTTRLLLANRAAFPGLSSAIGTRFSGNGDLLGLVRGALDETGAPRALQGSRGPVITSTVRVPDAVEGGGPGGWLRPRGHYVQDAGYPTLAEWVAELSLIREVTGRTFRFSAARMAASMRNSQRTTIGSEVARFLGPGSSASSTLPLLGMGRDVPDGVMSLRSGELAVDWTTVTSMAYLEGVRETMRTLADALGGQFRDAPLWMLRRVVTVHPLGGVPMGRDPVRGACDPYGEVYGYPGLHIADGAAVPGPVGPNPSLTIAALADRMCDRILGEPAGPTVPGSEARSAGTADSSPATSGPDPTDEADHSTAGEPTSPADLASVGTPVAVAGMGVPTSLRFTEEMKGWAGWGESSDAVGADVGRSRGQRLSFRLTISVPDVALFVVDQEHEGQATGTVSYDLLGGERPVERGWFNLFTRVDEPGTRQMRYRLHFRDLGGNPATLVGIKDVHDDPGADVWADTTTLRVRLVPGHVDEVTAWATPPLAAGILRIAAADFARQLTTFRTSGPDGLAALTSFNKLFLGQLWAVYHSRLPRTSRRARP